jgi:hypothetical protein
MAEDVGVTHVSRRSLLRIALAAPLASSVLTPTTPAAAQAPGRPRVQQVRLGPDVLRRLDPGQHGAESLGSGPEQTESATVLGTGSLDTEPFRLAALTWASARPTRAAMLVRTRNRDGRWSWTRVSDDGHGPDPGTSEARRSRGGTDPIIVDESDTIEVRVETPDGAVPDDLRLDLVHPGSSQADARQSIEQYGTAAAPTIRRRSDWGADESLREPGDPRYGEVRGAFVHHTAGSNTYTAGDVPGIIRSIYAYHVNGRGWRDIGYNFLVDKFGRIWEGRFGGIKRPVVGAHVAGYNFYAFGASVLGTYVNNEPEPEVLRAFADLIAWKFGVHDVDPTRVWYPGLKDVPAIAGHRDGGATQGPGDRLYAKLHRIRGGVANR